MPTKPITQQPENTMTFTDIITASDYDFAIGSDGDDLITYGQIPNSQKDLLFNSIGIDAIALKGGSDRYDDDDTSRITFGNAGNDTLMGHGGADTIPAGRDNDSVEGGSGDDFLFGNLGDDAMRGGENDDSMFGGRDNDVLLGDNGNDLVAGERGDDTISGSLGTDTLTGGSGADVFFLSRDGITSDTSQADRLTDFNAAEGDKIAFSAQDISISDLLTWTDGRITLKTGEVLGVVETGQPSFDSFIFLSDANTDDWLSRVNQFRNLAGLPNVTENPDWSAGGVLHSRYLVKNDTRGHTEDPSNPWYTVEGEAAGQSGNVTTSTATNRSDVAAVDGWMNAPFHAIGIIDPRLERVGFGSYSEADGGVQSAATLDVLRGLDFSASASYPVVWPQDGSTLPLSVYDGGEYPDPLAGSGFSEPTGTPLYVQLGSGSVTPNVTASSFSQNSVELPHIVFDETNYTNSDITAQTLGRDILDSRDAIVLIPQNPLEPGETYTASITANGDTTTWSFTVRELDEAALLLG
ncbi:CAP domain-containing protein [Baaleninema simplex]|uniref:CAP domain-containing protein n=1 Tax=Baaleninema simplex TaxID=2862350 RepID=UPI000379CAFE|nr:CAP domain-containing protein [Baaleninema simplex]